MIKQNIAIFISGRGTNAINLVNYFKDHPTIKVYIIISDHQNEEIRDFCYLNNAQFIQIDKTEASNSEYLISICMEHEVKWVVLAGFLKKIPEVFIQNFDKKIINIHPSLLPKYGGKGMYGDHVHKAVLDNFEAETGITIHLVNEDYDKGEIIAQFSIKIDRLESLESLRIKIRNLEHEMFPHVLEKHILNNLY
jgi:phosphoribosylglycinamide formyltransferase-1